jgi:hypothetical protein
VTNFPQFGRHYLIILMLVVKRLYNRIITQRTSCCFAVMMAGCMTTPCVENVN